MLVPYGKVTASPGIAIGNMAVDAGRGIGGFIARRYK